MAKKIILFCLSIIFIIELTIYNKLDYKYYNYKLPANTIPYTFKINRIMINIDNKAYEIGHTGVVNIKKKRNSEVTLVLPFNEKLIFDSKDCKILSCTDFIPDEYRFLLQDNDEKDIKLTRLVLKTPNELKEIPMEYKWDNKKFKIILEVVK